METWVSIASAFGAVALLAGLWVAIGWLLALLSGWSGLATRFSDRVVTRGERIHAVSAMVGLVSFNNALVLELDDRGLRFSTWIPFAGAFRAFHVPWNEFTAITPRQGMFRRRLDLEFRGGGSKVSLFGAAADRVLAASQRLAGPVEGDASATPVLPVLSNRSHLPMIAIVATVLAVGAAVLFFARYAQQPDAAATGATPDAVTTP